DGGVEGGGVGGAVGADDAVNGALGEGEFELGHGGKTAEAHSEALGREDRGAGHIHRYRSALCVAAAAGCCSGSSPVSSSSPTNSPAARRSSRRRVADGHSPSGLIRIMMMSAAP